MAEQILGVKRKAAMEPSQPISELRKRTANSSNGVPAIGLSKKQAKRDKKRAEKAQQSTSSSTSSSSSSSSSSFCREAGSSLYKRSMVLPLSCPFPNLENRFYYQTDRELPRLLTTSYSGFNVDPPSVYPDTYHDEFLRAFTDFDDRGIFQFDYTQPAGLGTKIAKTFVTRCLVGEPGITYKYLGLRMFAYPWDGSDALPSFAAIGQLNQALSKRSTVLLHNTKKKEVGSCAFNLTLINRCFPRDSNIVKLKYEPFFETEKCTVSWHADSSLEHYSTIAVYHCTAGGDNDDSWRIALRVAPYAEGPLVSKQLKEAAADTTGRAPPVAVPLPSRHTYYLLDDFNHHHQHAVLAGNTDRYASTHRVSRREGHTFQSIHARCLSALQGHGFSAKQVRTEQLALNEVEFEWIRQFFIQGTKHHELHVWWHKPIQELLALFEQLEARTLLAIDTLHFASGVEVSSIEAMDKKQRKHQARRQKRANTVEAATFEELISGLTERHVKRDGWLAREEDPAFKSASKDCRPMRIPLRFPSSVGGELIVDNSNGRSQQTGLLDAINNLQQWKSEFTKRS